MAEVEARIQHLVHIGRMNGGVTREQVREYVVDQGATPIDLVLTYFRLLQEGIPVLDPFQSIAFKKKCATALHIPGHGGPLTAGTVPGQTVAWHDASRLSSASLDRSNKGSFQSPKGDLPK
jgi:hypothetical protein